MSEPNVNPIPPGQTPNNTDTVVEPNQTPGTNGATSPTPTPNQPAPSTLTLEALKIPEGFEIEPEAGTKFLDIMNNSELDAAGRAQALIELQADLNKAASEKGSALWTETQETWAKEAKADPIIGGPALEPALGGIARLIDTYALDVKGKPDPAFAKELREVMDMTGAGNHPKVIRFLHNVASVLVKEGGPVSAGTPTGGPKDAASIMFPSMNQG